MNGKLRTFNWIAGTFLWAGVGVALWMNWRSENKGDAAPKTAGVETTGQTTPTEPEPLPAFEFTERNGKTITNKDLLGHPWAVSFVFTKCAGPCPKVSSQMKKVHDRLQETDARFVTITVDPERDTPEVLKQYAEIFTNDEDRWLFLTGDKTKTYRLIQTGFQMPVKELTGDDRKPGFEILHTTNILLVDAKGFVKGKYNSTDDAQLVKLRLALEEELEKEKS